jgi:hypothetical protein
MFRVDVRASLCAVCVGVLQYIPRQSTAAAAAPAATARATSVDVSAARFVGIPADAHLLALDALYAAVNPEKRTQVFDAASTSDSGLCTCGERWLRVVCRLRRRTLATARMCGRSSRSGILRSTWPTSVPVAVATRFSATQPLFG